jgi:hypothetical protein
VTGNVVISGSEQITRCHVPCSAGTSARGCAQVRLVQLVVEGCEVDASTTNSDRQPDSQVFTPCKTGLVHRRWIWAKRNIMHEVEGVCLSCTDHEGVCGALVPDRPVTLPRINQHTTSPHARSSIVTRRLAFLFHSHLLRRHARTVGLCLLV